MLPKINAASPVLSFASTLFYWINHLLLFDV